MKRTIYFSIVISQLLFLIFLPVFYQLFSYLHPIVIIVLWMCITALIFFLVFLIRKDTITIPRWLLNLLLAIYSLCLFVLLFIRPNEQVYDNWNLLPFSTISFYLTGDVPPLVAFYNLAANVVLFVPYGLIIMMNRMSKIMQYLLPLLFISMIEFLQFITRRGSLDIDDLILNMFGVYVGCLLTPVFQRVVRLKANESRENL
ncbi:VanZ family protein [Oceanobacillus chungangensis]|uniref:VanZ family protein n=1 Tax=Oceanobacillus chungangensis TaxID=1229152 RepID=A0A3D8PT88_9BACI|nr:VanZ family protein [Oceanobacillus chungangensis]RDW19360.1 VanZ family protein [Oceanobacillus chungangensis]